MDETARHTGASTLVTGGYGADGAVECVSPHDATIGQYAHRLAIAGSLHPVDGEQRGAHGKTWTWQADRHGWRRTA